MLALHSIRLPLSRRSGGGGLASVAFIALATLIAVTLASTDLRAQSQASPFSGKGRWLDAGHQGVVGTHVAVMRDPDDDSTKVFLFGGSGTAQVMKLFGFQAGASAVLPSTTNMIPVPHPAGDVAALDLFCGGHVILPDGRMLFAGGEAWSPMGLERAFRFDPRYPKSTVTNPWSRAALMAQERWYPTLTVLPNGKVLASSGTQNNYMLSFGGVDDAAAVKDSLHHMAVAHRPYWMSNSNPSTRPAARRWHTLVGDADRGMVYGGANGGASFGDVWYVQRQASTDSSWAWQQMVEESTAFYGRAAARSRHAMVPWRKPVGSDITRLGGFVFGGIDTLGNVLDDLWFGQRDPNTYPGLWKWTNLTPSPRPADWPSARYGHVAILDPGPPGANRPRVLVFGGRETGGALASNELWAYDINAKAFYRPPIGTPEGAPAAREGHAGVYEDCAGQCQRTIYSSSAARRMTFFGGQGAGALLSDLWGLWRLDQGPADTTYTWDDMALSGTQGTPASARTQMSGVYDLWADRLTIYGGDTNGESTSGGQSDEVVHFELRDAITSNKTRWNRTPLRTPDFSSHNDPRPRAGHAALFDGVGRTARFPEMYDPAHADTGSWTTAHVSTNDPPILELYPLMFVLPNGKVFHGGPRDHDDPYPYLFDPATNLWDAATHSSDYSASSAAMFRPGYVLRGGKHSDGDGAAGVSTSDSISFDGSVTSGWHEVMGSGIGDMGARANSNLTILPTGDVVVTGGLDGEELSSSVNEARIWSSKTGAWSGDLNPDHHPRNYHSTAILLPDGRVLSAGGERNPFDLSNTTRFHISLFEPPYLFDGDALATRPTVSSPGLPSTLEPAQRFTVCTPQAATISSVALVKPGAVTHGFNQDQRYVPLAFTRVTGANPRLHVTAPPDMNHAPPGDYLLFVVDSANVPAGKNPVPSVGRWLRVQSSGGADLCDTYGPGKVTALNGCHDEATNTVNFSWVSPPEDSAVTGSGPGTEFSLRYSTSSINNETAWTSATPVSLGFSPGTEGATHTAQLSLSNGTYFFRLKTKDDNGNWSAMSTQSTVEVPADPPTECFEGGGGGGGGGGSRARRGSDALAMLPGSGEGSPFANATTLFARPVREGTTADLVRLSFDPSQGGEEARVWVAANAGVGMRLDRVALRVVDHAATHEALVSGDGIVTGVLGEVEAITRSGEPQAAESFALESGDAVEVDLGLATTLVLETTKVGESTRGQRNGLLVQVPHEGGWRVHSRLVPRRVAERVALPVGGSIVRLLALEDTRIERVGVLTQAATAQPITLALASASGVDDIDVTEALSVADESRVSLGGGESVSATFATPQPADGLVRTWFLAASASFEGASQATSTRRSALEPEMPLRFALHQNHPNPFSRATRITFDLPRGERVSLDVYDAQGRRVRTLTSGWRPVGRHAVEWDQRDDDGGLVRPGVYLYRLRSGSAGVIERKLVVLP